MNEELQIVIDAMYIKMNWKLKLAIDTTDVFVSDIQICISCPVYSKRYLLLTYFGLLKSLASSFWDHLFQMKQFFWLVNDHKFSS